MISKHTNFKYDGTLPFFIGDRRYGQDIIKDYWSMISSIGEAIKGLVGEETFLLNGGIISQGSSLSEINITELTALIKTKIDISNEFDVIPPTKTTSDISIPLYIEDQVNLTGFLTNNLTNYVKLSYNFVNGNIRDKAKKVGSYVFEGNSSIKIVIDQIAPTQYELLLGTVTGNGTTYLTITQEEFIRTPINAESIKTDNVFLKTKVIDIGDWDMDTDTQKNVAHNIDDHTKIRDVSIMIRNDTPTTGNIYRLDSANGTGSSVLDGGIDAITNTSISMSRVVGGFFDNTGFDSTTYNRGWITILYEK